MPTRVGLPDGARWLLSGALIVAPFLVMPSIIGSFRRAGSEYDVRRVPHGLVTDGAFRYSRNLGYVPGIGLCAGIGLAADNRHPAIRRGVTGGGGPGKAVRRGLPWLSTSSPTLDLSRKARTQMFGWKGRKMADTQAWIDNEVKSNDMVLFMKGTPAMPQCGSLPAS